LVPHLGRIQALQRHRQTSFPTVMTIILLTLVRAMAGSKLKVDRV
jgi:hypothetical protein